MLIIFFVKQKTAYEMRISDWSSDVCSSDLQPPPLLPEDDVFGEHAHQPRALVAFGIQPILEILGRQEPGLGFTGPGSSRRACCNRQDEQCQPRLPSVPPRLHVLCASILHATPRDDLPLPVAQLPDVRALPLCLEWLIVQH